MKKRFLVILSLLFICGGIALAAVGKVKGGSFSWRFDLAKFKVVAGNNDYISETVKVGAFNKLVIDTSTIDVNISRGSEYSVSYYLPEDKKPEITENNGVLTVKGYEKNSFMVFDFSFLSSCDDAYINVTIPDGTYTKVVDIKSSTADIKISSLNVDGSISTSTGDIRLDDNEMCNFTLSVSTGDIFIKNCNFESLETKASTGEVKIDNCVINGNYIAKTSTGDVTINDSELGRLTLNGSTSDVTVSSSSIDNIKIETSTGEVKLSLLGNEEDYTTEIHTSTGDIDINGEEYEKKYKKVSSGINSINISTSTGDVDIDFGK